MARQASRVTSPPFPAEPRELSRPSSHPRFFGSVVHGVSGPDSRILFGRRARALTLSFRLGAHSAQRGRILSGFPSSFPSSHGEHVWEPTGYSAALPSARYERGWYLLLRCGAS
eukprot:scaffold3323_cov279-Pinguiococcus_pyrenoidosus.AAC.12